MFLTGAKFSRQVVLARSSGGGSLNVGVGVVQERFAAVLCLLLPQLAGG